MSLQRAQDILAHLVDKGVTPAGISADSRSLRPGEIFAAWPGEQVDARRFIADAIARGACAALWECSDGFEPGALTVPAMGVDGLRALSGYLAHEVYGRPSSGLWVAGVTGTNGKTTVTQWLLQALNTLETRAAVIGTLGYGFGGRLSELDNTTPDAIALHRLLAEFRDEGAAAVAMEVSSIGLDQGRVNGIDFDVAVLTNLSRDHIDYHGSMQAYGQAKQQLFEQMQPGVTVLNLDDAFGLALARRLAGGKRVIGYTRFVENAHAVEGIDILLAEHVRMSPAGLRFRLVWQGESHDVELHAVAAFNIANALAVVGALLGKNVPFDEIVQVIPLLVPPEGRMQLVGGVGEPLVVIDYAHSPDALSQALESVAETARARQGALVCVFGCGGDRDAGKRPLMGEAACRLADRVIVTNDNPRGEEPVAIASEILAGASVPARCILDRSEAIRIAIAEAADDDVIVIAGKGHEHYQEVKGERLPFSDAAQAQKSLRERSREKRGDG